MKRNIWKTGAMVLALSMIPTLTVPVPALAIEVPRMAAFDPAADPFSSPFIVLESYVTYLTLDPAAKLEIDQAQADENGQAFLARATQAVNTLAAIQDSLAPADIEYALYLIAQIQAYIPGFSSGGLMVPAPEAEQPVPEEPSVPVEDPNDTTEEPSIEEEPAPAPAPETPEEDPKDDSSQTPETPKDPADEENGDDQSQPDSEESTQKPDQDASDQEKPEESKPEEEQKPEAQPEAEQKPAQEQKPAEFEKKDIQSASPVLDEKTSAFYLGARPVVNAKVLINRENKKIQIESLGEFMLLPDFKSEKAWKASSSSYNTPYLWGQCTWFAWGRFYELYGFDPGFTGNGYQCAGQLLEAHPDLFEESDEPKAGAIFSSDLEHNHVGIILDIDEETDLLTIQEGNLDGRSNPDWQEAIEDYRTVQISKEDLETLYGDITYAVPKEDTHFVGWKAPEKKTDRKAEVIEKAQNTLSAYKEAKVENPVASRLKKLAIRFKR